MVSLFLNPNGRIERFRFWQGMVVLTVASVIISAAIWLVHPNFEYLNWALIFPYVCVYGKRLHDAGQSAWWVIAIWVTSLLLQVIAMAILMFTLFPNLMTPEQTEIWRDIIELMDEGDTNEAMKGIELLMAEMDGLFQRTSIALLVVTNLIMALIVGAFRTDPDENKHGPVPTRSAADTFQ